MKNILCIAILACSLVGISESAAQQLGDHGFVPDIQSPSFEPGTGPRVAIDQAHHNFHTLSGRFAAFGELLAADGYAVDSLDQPATAVSLADVDLLVMSNALHESNDGNWARPHPSAFGEDEISAIVDWVSAGGALLLIADHMPFPAAAGDLAAAFGFQMNNGFAFDTTLPGPMIFRLSDGSLAVHAVTNGRSESERVDSVATFTGQAIESPSDATDLLVFRRGVESFMPERPWEFDSTTVSVDVSGWSQGSVMAYGAGRLAIFGEAAMFTAQLAGPQQIPVGINSPVASQNASFILNLVRWLVSADQE